MTTWRIKAQIDGEPIDLTGFETYMEAYDFAVLYLYPEPVELIPGPEAELAYVHIYRESLVSA